MGYDNPKNICSNNNMIKVDTSHLNQQPLIPEKVPRGYYVRPVKRNECEEYILDIHYAGRWPSISYAYGLLLDGVLCGIVTYGTPPSAPLRKGICGEEFSDYVLELNRLCLKHNRPNEASMLVGRSLQKLPNSVVISFADQAQDHTGYVYQACNFNYVGLSAKRTDWKVKGMDDKHGQTIADEFRGFSNRADKMREKYGDDFYLEERSRKHRYVYFTGDKRFRRKAKKALKYKIKKYPKDTTND